MTTELVINKLINAFESLDAVTSANLFSKDATFHNIPMGITIGRIDIQNNLTELFSSVDSIRWEILNKVIQGNTAVVERINHIVFKDGKIISLPMVTVAQIENSQVTVFKDYFDLKSFSDQMSS